MIDLKTMGKGAIPLPLARKDYRLEVAAGAVLLPAQYSLRQYVGSVKNQNGSLSCVGQAFASYGQLINYFEELGQTELSARDIYSLIYQPTGGAWLKDACDKILNSGIVLEKDAPSYQNGNPPEELFMRGRDDITKEEVEHGKTYIALKYVTWDAGNLEQYKQAVKQGNGAVVAVQGNNYLWSNADILLPDVPSQFNWWHAILMTGWDDNKKAFEFVNSWGKEWGDNGFGWLPYEYITRGYTTNPFTLIDVSNLQYTKLISQIKNLMEMIIKLLQEKIKLKK